MRQWSLKPECPEQSVRQARSPEVGACHKQHIAHRSFTPRTWPCRGGMVAAAFTIKRREALHEKREQTRAFQLHREQGHAKPLSSCAPSRAEALASAQQQVQRSAAPRAGGQALRLHLIAVLAIVTWLHGAG